MKQKIILFVLLLCTANLYSQNRFHRVGITAGGSIQHYNGNLGSSLFQFETVCFAGITSNVNIYLNESFDLSIGNAIGDFGYCATEQDKQRTVAMELRCPGQSCAGFASMGNLRSRMVSNTLTVRYKLSNGYLLPSTSKVVPYVYGGLGSNYLSDVMGKDCVNVGFHFTLNTGAGIRYDITDRINIGYNLDVARFTGKKVYRTNEDAAETVDVYSDHPHPDGFVDEHSINPAASAMDPEMIRINRRNDLCVKNSISIGFNF